jgi:hypothetical protein
MMLLTAAWTLGYTALITCAAVLLYQLLSKSHHRGVQLAAQILLVTSTLLLWTSLVMRAMRGHGWPFQSPADLATGIALLMLLLYTSWSLSTRQQAAAVFVSTIAWLLLSFALIQQPLSLSTQPYPSPGVRIGTLLNLAGGALLALGAATSLSALIGLTGPRVPSTDQQVDDQSSEAFVRVALFCLAGSLAIDTWWLQKVGLGNINDAQQAGIAVTWMVYFVAIRLRSQPDWKGWPWTALVTVGFVCTLPILLNVPWLESTLAL